MQDAADEQQQQQQQQQLTGIEQARTQCMSTSST